jgi:hypothetical protein
VKRTNRYINCLSSNHPTRKCTSSYDCTNCKKHHNTLLHFSDSTVSSNGIVSSINLALSTNNVDSTVTSQFSSCLFPRVTATQQVLLTIAWIELLSPSGRSEKIRALLDRGSVISIISEHLMQQSQELVITQSFVAHRQRLPPLCVKQSAYTP